MYLFSQASSFLLKKHSIFFSRKFTNYILRKGKKRLARSLVNETFEKMKRMQLVRYHKAHPEHQSQITLDPVEIFHKAVSNCTPVMQLEKMRRAGTGYMVSRIQNFI